MSRVYRTTPLDTLEELRRIYSGAPDESIPFVANLNEAKANIEDIIDDEAFKECGVVMAIEGTWGSGKSSFVNFLCKDLAQRNVAIVQYDSLFYGNVSEATDIFIKGIFGQVKEYFGVKLRNGSGIAKNITPSFELSNGLPSLSLNFAKTREPTEILQSELNAKLRKLSGKVVVVIDDLDRVSGEDVIHFLRVVRVLRELPNFIIILPIDRQALESLLLSQGITAPNRYLQKIIDDVIDLNPEQGSSRELFLKLLRSNNREVAQVSEETLNTAWDLLLWELALLTIKKHESGIAMTAQSTDHAVWQQADSYLRSANPSSNLIREFFNRTTKSYGGDYNFVLRVQNDQDAHNDFYRHYTTLFPGVGFADFISGNCVPNLAPAEHLENTNKINFVTTRWWRDLDYIVHHGANLSPGAQATEYTLHLPDEGDSRGTHYGELNRQSVTMWDITRDLAAAYLPTESLQYLAPRTLYKIASKLSSASLLNASNADLTPDALLPMQNAMHNAVLGAITSDDLLNR